MNTGDANTIEPIQGGHQPPQEPLYTMGYGSRTIEEFMALLRKHHLALVVDVRTAPYSRFKPEFSKEAFEAALKARGLRYLFLGNELGGQPKDPACYTDGKVDYAKLRAQPFFQAGLERVKDTCRQQIGVILVCSEGRPEQCHRTKLIGEALAADGIPVCHIDEDGRLRTQTEVIDRLTGGQLDLFGQPAFTSRKHYPAGDPAEEER
jgi:uncharacterized protein (DUF488 family)